MTTTNKIVVFEYDKPLERDKLLNHEAGIWYWKITPGNVTVVDDNGNTGFYDYTNSTVYTIQSLRVNETAYSKTTSLADCRLTNESFFYDQITTELYIHFDQFEPPLDKQILVGTATGFIYKENDQYYFNDFYYDPRVQKVFTIKKNKDPLFFGVLKFQKGKVTLLNQDGELDDWRDRELFGQAARIYIGEKGTTYGNLETIFTGFIENDSRTWDDLSVTIQDVRKNLSQPIAENRFNKTEFPFLDDSNVDEPKPVAYGEIFNAPCVCTNETESTTEYTFFMCDTTYNAVDSLDTVYIAGVSVTPNSSDLINGRFTLTSAQVGDNKSEVTADFTVNIKDGVEITKDLIANYDNKPFLASFWDTDEVNSITGRNTSLYIKDDTKLRDGIASVMFDIDGVFFAKNDSRYTIRIYDANRTPTKTINKTEWIDGGPKIKNNGSEFLTSVTVAYRKDQNEDNFTRNYENTDFVDTTFDKYRTIKTKTIETGLTTEADAILKSTTVMNFSSNIEDIVERTTSIEHVDLEIMDFIICDPITRVSQDEVLAVYEVLGISFNPEDLTVTLTMRRVSSYTVPTPPVYKVLINDSNDFIISSNGNTIITQR